MPFLALCAAVFTVAAANDFVWSRYIAAVGAQRPFMAGFWAAGTLLFGAFGIVSYTTDHRLAIPAALGCFFGSFSAVYQARAATRRENARIRAAAAAQEWVQP